MPVPPILWARTGAGRQIEGQCRGWRSCARMRRHRHGSYGSTTLGRALGSRAPRQNLYEALVTLEPVAGVWKITGLEVLNEQRLDRRT